MQQDSSDVSKIPLFVCPVCKHAIHGICAIKSEVTVAQEKCDSFDWKGTAEWIFYAECPYCDGGGMLQQDKFGASCVIRDCGFRQEYELPTEAELGEIKVRKINRNWAEDMFSFPPDTYERPRKDFTCMECDVQQKCPSAYYWYNVSGDCMAMK